jgi:methionyl-tRNA formyltransferase
VRTRHIGQRIFNQRLNAAALALPTRGCLNIHPSLLPEAKGGVDPVFQAILRGAPQLGVTAHFMSLELDAGRIVAQRSIGAGPSLTYCVMDEYLIIVYNTIHA